ncbi:MAG: hypothetical protein ACKOAX_05055 [Candidatus Kapaibacterium sp.]
MFESDIERSKLRLIEAVDGYQASTYLRDIVACASVDYAYKQYFEAEFAWWLYEEQTVRKTNPHVDPHDPETASILRDLDLRYHKNARFERDQLLSIADAAVKGVLNYRVRPRTTLKWFVYRGEPTKPIHEIYLRMRYFADYPYLHEGFNRWLVQRGLRFDSLDIISVLEFERLIKRIDDDAILDLSPSEFVNMIVPIGYCFPPDPGEPADRGIPIEAVIIFLDDKEVYVIAQKLEHMLYQQGIRFLTKDMFLSVVDEVLAEVEDEPRTETPPARPVRPVEPPTTFVSDQVSGQVSDQVSASPAPMPTMSPVPAPIPAPIPAPDTTPTLRPSELIRVQTVRETAAADQPVRTSGAPAVDAIPVAPRERSGGIDVPRSADDDAVKQEAPAREAASETVTEKPADRDPGTSADVPPVSVRSHAYPSVTDLCDARQQEMFVRKICAGSEDTFKDMTTQIDATSNWKEALAVLDKHYAKGNIDPQSAPARDLRMIIYRRFIAV